MRLELTSFLAVLCLAIASPVLASPPSAVPEVSLGSNPYRSFGGTVPVGPTPQEILTVPEGQEFIVTMVVTEGLGRVETAGIFGSQLNQDGTPVLGGRAIGSHSFTGIGRGLGRLRVEEGTTLSIEYNGGDSDSDFYLQGYFVQAGSPYRSFYGATPSAGRHAVFTADADRDFIVRSAVAWGVLSVSNNCDIYLDGALHVSRNLEALYSNPAGGGDYAGPLATGFTGLVVPAGSQLELGNSSSGCGYYLDGEYITP